MWTPRYFTRYVALPSAVKGVTVPNDDGSFSIYINSALPDAQQRATLDHEVRHIVRDHFYNDRATVAEVETDAETVAPIAG